MGRIPGDAERRCIELFCQVLRTSNVSPQHRFDFLRGEERYKYEFGPTAEEVFGVRIEPGPRSA